MPLSDYIDYKNQTNNTLSNPGVVAIANKVAIGIIALTERRVDFTFTLKLVAKS